MRKLTRVSEAEVVSEFLKSEFGYSEYDRDREQFHKLVFEPDLNNREHNHVRHVLLFRRRDTLWRELPRDMQWWEINLSREDLRKIRIFPRAQWRTVACGDFSVDHVADAISQQIARGDLSPLATKIQSISKALRTGTPTQTVMMIAKDESSRLTLIDGNHRFLAALLMGEAAPAPFRYICGFSPNMESCCWYSTNVSSLSHYLKNRIQHLWWDRDAGVYRWYPVALRSRPAGIFKQDGLPPVDTLKGIEEHKIG